MKKTINNFEIEQYQMSNYSANVYNTDQYKLLKIDFLFEVEYTRKNWIMLSILTRYLKLTNEVYKDAEEIEQQSSELYSCSVGFPRNCYGSKIIMELYISMCDEKAVGEKITKDVLQYAHNILYKPNFKNNKLDQKIKSKIINSMISRMEDILKNYKAVAERDLVETLFGKDSYYTFVMYDNIEEYKELIESITDEDIIAFYHNVLNNCFVGLNIVGNVNDELLQYIDELFKFKNIKQLDTDYYKKFDYQNVDDYKKVVDEKVGSSILYAFYELDSNIDPDMYKILLLILHRPGMLMHRILRDEMDLVYTCGVAHYRYNGIYLSAYISAENEEKCLVGFNNCLEKLKDRGYVEERIKYILENKEETEFLLGEKINDLVRKAYYNFLQVKTSDSELIEKIKTITADDIAHLVDTLSLKFVYKYEGTK